jgi:DNA-binding protein HU-beta
VNKSELINAIAAETKLSKSAASNALDATIKAVSAVLKKGERLSLVGFGSFWVGDRAARTGRNPQTGKPLKIKAAKVPKFTPGKALKEVVNSKKK